MYDFYAFLEGAIKVICYIVYPFWWIAKTIFSLISKLVRDIFRAAYSRFTQWVGVGLAAAFLVFIGHLLNLGAK